MLVTLIAALMIAGYTVAAQLTLLNHARIERSEMLYRTLIEGEPDWISIVDEAGAFVFTNKAGMASTGLGSTAQTRSQVERLLGPKTANEIASRVREAAGAGIVSLETPVPTAPGETRTWRLTFVPLEPEGAAASAILIGHDVTDVRRAEERLVRVERMAAVGTLAAGIAHQFNNINAAALGYLQVLALETGLTQSAARYAGLVREALERSVELTSRFMPLSVSSTDPEPDINLVDVAREAIHAVQPDLDKEAVSLKILSFEPAVACVNYEQLSFIVHALLVNAWHAVIGQPNRVIRISTGTSAGMAFLRVQDTGAGIAPEKMSSLFTPFFTEKGEHAPAQSPQARLHGVGLSLAVSHAIVTGHAGRIEVDSELGAGSTFTIWLPGAPAGA